MRKQLLSLFCPLFLMMALLGLQEYRVDCVRDASSPLETTHISQQFPGNHSSFHHSPTVSETSEEEEVAHERQVGGKILCILPEAVSVARRGFGCYQANEQLFRGYSFLLNCNLRL